MSGERGCVTSDSLFAAAARRNFPAFLTPIALSTPANATPFVVGSSRFGSLARKWPGRTRLVDALERAIAEFLGGLRSSKSSRCWSAAASPICAIRRRGTSTP